MLPVKWVVSSNKRLNQEEEKKRKLFSCSMRLFSSDYYFAASMNWKLIFELVNGFIGIYLLMIDYYHKYKKCNFRLISEFQKESGIYPGVFSLPLSLFLLDNPSCTSVYYLLLECSLSSLHSPCSYLSWCWCLRNLQSALLLAAP